jgi:dCTP deaminase
MLTANEIYNQIKLGNIVIKEFKKENLISNPNSYNLTLHNELQVYKKPYGLPLVLSFKEKNETETIEIPESGLLLQPNTLYLGRTAEYTETHNLIPCINGRSSVGRLGVFVHVTAGFGDIGFKGYWTLEIVTVHPVVIFPFTKICQIYYYFPDGEIGFEYDGKYQDNCGIQESRIYKELT